MIKIQVKDTECRTINFKDKRTGESRSFKTQEARAYLANSQGKIDETSDKFEIALNSNDAPFEVGFYQLTPACIYLDRNGRLQVGLSNMQKLQPAQKPALAA